MATNRAAFLLKKQERPFVVEDAPVPQPESHQVVIKVKAAAINPVDCMIQKTGMIVEEYPTVLGIDHAGEIYSVGSAVKNFKVGDRVMASADNMPEDKFLKGCFQYYAVTDHRLVSKIPESIKYTDACVLPLGMATASTGLFDKRCMHLNLPNIQPKPTGETLLVWGGATSVGSCAIQLAIAGGYEVITTASSKNFEYCKSIGAKEVFDYKKDSVTDEILAYLKGKKSAGVFMSVIGPPTLYTCVDIAAKADGHKRVGTVMPMTFPLPEDLNKEVDTTYSEWWNPL